MSTLNLLYQKKYQINDYISVVIPTVGEIIENEDGYYNLVSILTAMPIDMMVVLDDAGIDFSTINDYELFLLMFEGLKTQDTSLVFGDLDLTKFTFDINPQNGNLTLFDSRHGIRIDRAIHGQIAAILRKIHNIKPDHRKPANKEARDYMIERARIKMKRRQKKKEDSHLEQLIIALVNTEQFSYDYESVKNLTIYQFNESVKQIIKKIDYDNIMHGIYAGTVDVNKINQEDLHWLGNK